MFFSSKPKFNFDIKDATILDVRTPQEFNEDHVQGSRNIPIDEITVRVEEVKKFNKPIVVVCMSGSRSGRAVDYLKSIGMENVYNGGGYLGLK